MEYIRNYYKVPAKVGGRVEYTGDPGVTRQGVITGECGGYLKIRLDGDRKSLNFHPIWELKYLED